MRTCSSANTSRRSSSTSGIGLSSANSTASSISFSIAASSAASSLSATPPSISHARKRGTGSRAIAASFSPFAM